MGRLYSGTAQIDTPDGCFAPPRFPPTRQTKEGYPPSTSERAHGDSLHPLVYSASFAANRDKGPAAIYSVSFASNPTCYQEFTLGLANQSGGIGAILNGIRRLTPLECERLQGFPDQYTSIPYRGKPAADAPRYRALGNSMAVNVMAWIGQRIAMVTVAISNRSWFL